MLVLQEKFLKIKHLIEFGKLNSLMQLVVYIHYLLLFFNNDSLKYTATCQRKSFNCFPLLYILSLVAFFFIITKNHQVYNLCSISYTLNLCYSMLYIVSKCRIAARFFKDCIYCCQ